VIINLLFTWNKYVQFGKDTYYRLMNNPRINWRGFLFAVAIRSLESMSERITNETDIKAAGKAIKAFIFDDTPIKKTGQNMEGVSRIWNHVIQKHILGYQLLVMGLYTGIIFIPLNFSLHREKGKNASKPYGFKKSKRQKQFNKKRDSKTAGAKRKKELDITKIASLVRMIKMAIKAGFTADYVLTDSWYTCWETVKTALDNGLHYIGMFSIVKTKFKFNNKQLTYNEIRHMNRKNIKRNKRFKLYYIRTVVQWNGRNIVLYATRKGRNGKWRYIISTDISLNFTQTIEIYQIRWSIEVFFKESKQHFMLGKNQSQDFDSQISDTTLRMIEYIFIALQHKVEKYESIGKIFEQHKEYAKELKLHERLVLLLIAVIDIIEILFNEADFENIFENVIYNQKAQDRLYDLLKKAA